MTLFLNGTLFGREERAKFRFHAAVSNMEFSISSWIRDGRRRRRKVFCVSREVHSKVGERRHEWNLVQGSRFAPSTPRLATFHNIAATWCCPQLNSAPSPPPIFMWCLVDVCTLSECRDRLFLVKQAGYKKKDCEQKKISEERDNSACSVVAFHAFLAPLMLATALHSQSPCGGATTHIIIAYQ